MSDLTYKALLVGNSTFPEDPNNLPTLKEKQENAFDAIRCHQSFGRAFSKLKKVGWQSGSCTPLKNCIRISSLADMDHCPDVFSTLIFRQ